MPTSLIPETSQLIPMPKFSRRQERGQGLFMVPYVGPSQRNEYYAARSGSTKLQKIIKLYSFSKY